MKGILVAWSVLNALCATGLAPVVLYSPFIRLLCRRRPVSGPLLLALHVVPAIGHAAVTLAAGLFFSLGVAVIFSGAVVLHWALVAYFLRQRFADSGRRAPVAMRMPLFLPACVMLGIISTAVALALYAVWYWIAAIVAAWFIYGYTCAELAIRRYMRESSCERRPAISAVNRAQGRRTLQALMEQSKYPFP